jgi:hypothetical protein
MNVNYEFGRVCEMEGRRILSHSGICLERLRKPAANLRDYSRCPIRYSNGVFHSTSIIITTGNILLGTSLSLTSDLECSFLGSAKSCCRHKITLSTIFSIYLIYRFCSHLLNSFGDEKFIVTGMASWLCVQVCISFGGHTVNNPKLMA